MVRRRPLAVRVKVDERINLADGKKGGRAENFDLIQYRAIILANWSLFEPQWAGTQVRTQRMPVQNGWLM